MNVRKYIVDVLCEVSAHDGFASLIMRHQKSDLSSDAYRLASEVIYGTIRNQTLLEYQWKQFARKKTDIRTKMLIDSSVYQMFFLDSIPDYAVIHDAVEICSKHQKAFVNAVLRNVQRQGFIRPQGDSPEELSILYSHPLWLVKMWQAHYGKEKMLEIIKSDQERPLMYARVNTLKTDRAELEKMIDVTWLSDTSFIYQGNPGNDPLIKDGRILIQDLHSQQVVTLLDVKEGMRVLDCCASPGTKTQQIACRMHNTGSITACDIHEFRVDLIRQLMEKTGTTNVTAMTRDSSVMHEEEMYDRILMDVPCSGLGDLRHKPEIRWNCHPEDIDAMVSLQYRILCANAVLLKPGGVMVYSTCTINQKENERQIIRFLKEYDGFELVKEKMMFPMEENADGFYAAQIVRKSI